MKYYPSDIFESLEFDKIIEKIKLHCSCEASKGYLVYDFFTNPDKLKHKLNQIEELKNALELNKAFSIVDFDQTEDVIPLLLKQDYVLEIEQIVNLKSMVQQMESLQNWCTEEVKELYPLHTQIILGVNFEIELKEAFNRVFNEENEIREDASPTLKSIYAQIRSKEKELDRKFAQILQSHKSKNYLTDTEESYKNGRRVLSVQAENKRKIKGIIHDESATGKTVFIEPDVIIEINNDLFELQNDKRKELYKIFRDLCNFLSSYIDDFKAYEEIFIELDLNKAKAKLAVELDAVKPKISKDLQFAVKSAFHPLLHSILLQDNKKVVPFDLTLEKNRILLLSGPNAGGKSVTMKASGLIQLMFQYGLLVPAQEAELSIFESFFGDIGDQQSLEDDLSTYSSRLKNMDYFVQNGDEKTFLVIDEFGSGTDPKIGGAIAEAVLQKMVKNRCLGVITTHYSNLKVYAYKNQGIVNGAMIFDEESMNPTFQMRIGRPGSSFAFEMAKKIGMPKSILDSARSRAGDNVKAIDQMLVDLQREKKEVEEKLKSLSDKQNNLDRLVKNYETLHRELEVRRKKLKLDLKEVAIKAANEKKKELNKFLKSLEKKKSEEKAKMASKQAKENLKNLQEDSKKLREELFYAEEIDVSSIVEGSYVRLRSSDTVGKVIRLKKKKVELEVGDLKMIVPLSELRPSKEAIEAQPKKSVNLAVNAGVKAHTKLDLRGYRKAEALLILEDFVDKALINNLNNLEVIHGKGNGTLRKIVKQKLKEYSDIKRVYHPEENDGVTYIEL